MQNKNALQALFVANTISGFAQGISMIGIPWYFVDVLNKPSEFAYIYSVVTLVSMIWSLYAGTLNDRYDRKYLFVFENIIGACILFIVSGWAYYTNSTPIEMLILVFASIFFLYNIHYPALYAFVQEISEPKHYNKLTSYLEIQGQLTSALAGGMAAIMLNGYSGKPLLTLFNYDIVLPFTFEAWPLKSIFLLNAIAFVIALLTVNSIKYKAVAVRKIEKAPVFKQLATGFSFLQQHKLLLLFGVVSLFVFATTMMLTFVLMPNYTKNVLNASANTFALGELYFALGSIGAGLVAIIIFGRNPVGNILLAVLSGSAFIVLSFNKSEFIFYIAIALLGLGNAGSRIMRITYLLQHVPNSVVGRTQSIYSLANYINRFLFIQLFALPFFVNNVDWAFVICSIWCLIAAILLLIYYNRLQNLNISTNH